MQLYDERGNPINPRSQQYGRKLRSAQNDVLASVGVVERRRSSSHGLPGSSEERFELLEAEDTVGNAVALVTTLTENLCTWWIGTVGDRILVRTLSNSMDESANSYRRFAITMPFPLVRLLLPSIRTLEHPSSMRALLLEFLPP